MVSLLREVERPGKRDAAGLVDIEILEAETGRLASRLELGDEVLVPNGYLDAATIVVLADAARRCSSTRATRRLDGPSTVLLKADGFKELHGDDPPQD